MEAGHDAAHWSQAGDKEAEDTEICAYAREHGFVVLTNDLDLAHILEGTRAGGPV